MAVYCYSASSLAVVADFATMPRTYIEKYTLILEGIFRDFGMFAHVSSINRKGSVTHSLGRSIDIAGFVTADGLSVIGKDVPNDKVIKICQYILTNYRAMLSQILYDGFVYDLRHDWDPQSPLWKTDPDFKSLMNEHKDHIHITLKRITS